MTKKLKSKRHGVVQSREVGAGLPSASDDKSEHLGKFLVASAPRGDDLELPPRGDRRGDPFAVDENGGA
jgi:hypothetical protein